MGRNRGIQYRPGSFYRQDDRSGFTRRAGETEQEWTGLIVGKDLWESRQPQDFVRAVADDQTVPKARPVPPNVFVGPFSVQIAVDAGVGANILYLDNVRGMTPGDPIGVMQISGEYFRTFIQAIDYDNDAIYLGAPLPGQVKGGDLPLGNLVTDFLEPTVDVAPAMIFNTAENSQYIGLIAGDCNG